MSFVGNLGSSLINNLFENRRAKQQREWNEQMMDKQNEWSLNMWNMTNEYNTPAAQKARLLEAGMNPLYYGLDGSSANGLESAQPLGYERANGPVVGNPVESYMSAKMQDAQIDQMEAATDKIKSETDQTFLENEFLEKTMDARVRGEELANELDAEKIKNIKEDTKRIIKSMEKMDAEILTEGAKQIWYAMDSALKEGELQRLLTLLPLEANLLEAKTASERAMAG